MLPENKLDIEVLSVKTMDWWKYIQIKRDRTVHEWNGTFKIKENSVKLDQLNDLTRKNKEPSNLNFCHAW